MKMSKYVERVKLMFTNGVFDANYIRNLLDTEHITLEEYLYITKTKEDDTGTNQQDQ
jgi:hypothetical protein